MNKYRVSFWFGVHNANPFILPSEIIEVESEVELTDKEATLEALKIIGVYPKIYSTLVHKIKNEEMKNKKVKEQFDVCVDDDKVNIIDWIQSHFHDGNWHKNFEVTVSLREIDYTEDGDRVYVEE